MQEFYFKKSEKVQHIQVIVADLETRLKALQGNEFESQYLAKETKGEKMEILQNHITNLSLLHEYVESFFEAWITEQKQLDDVKS